ncbi:hypothetical protein, partial [Rhizobium leguminosarum]|uniref:hypothetical protein n=1 Tax=Rhizobium leguminosarum TaxID=384 RepID=UPI003F97C062
HDSGESCIQFNYSDFVKIVGNETYNNASSCWFSCISIYENRNITGDTSTTGYRNIDSSNDASVVVQIYRDDAVLGGSAVD